MRRLFIVFALFVSFPAHAGKKFEVCWDMGKLTEKYVLARDQGLFLPSFADVRWTRNVTVIGAWAHQYAKATLDNPEVAGKHVYDKCMKHFDAASYGDAIGRNFSKDSIER